MEFEEFKEQIKADLPSMLPEHLKNAKIMNHEVEKLQGVSYSGIVIRQEDESISPTINITAAFQKYELGMPYEDALKEIADLVETGLDYTPDMNLSELQDYSKMRDKLCVQVVETERNRERLKSLPHKELEDMSMVYRIDLGSSKEGNSSILITNQLLNVYGISEEQLHQDAMEVAPIGHPFVIKPMSEVIKEIMKDKDCSDEEISIIPDEVMQDERMYVASVSGGNLGAGIITYPDFMEKAAERVGGDFFILPSSTHEVLLIPDDGMIDVEILRDMVRDVNDTTVVMEDKLTDSVYHYDNTAKVFELSEKFEARQRERDMGQNEKSSILKELGEKVKECAEHPPVRRSLELGEGVTI
ncbi:MAG: DUF5688 family protein [bacterium]|nr:DUF5688 family protein [bacterium]